VTDIKGQEPKEADGEDPQKTDGQEPTGNGQPQPEGTLDAEALAAELKKVRREAAKYRTSLRKLEEAEEERKKAEMTESERIKAELAEAQAKAAEAEERATGTMLRMSIVSAAAKAGFKDPTDAWSMIDPDTLATLEVSEDEKVIGADEYVTRLLKEKPYLAKQAQGSITPTNPQGGPVQMTDEERRAKIFGARKSGFWNGGGVMPFKE